jgi:hypothetical protein
MWELHRLVHQLALSHGVQAGCVCQNCSGRLRTSHNGWEKLAQGSVGKEAKEQWPQAHQGCGAQQLPKNHIKGDTLSLQHSQHAFSIMMLNALSDTLVPARPVLRGGDLVDPVLA